MRLSLQSGSGLSLKMKGDEAPEGRWHKRWHDHLNPMVRIANNDLLLHMHPSPTLS